MEPNWNQTLRDQWEFHWDNQLRPRLAGLTDDEYFWEPAPGAWSVRPRGTSAAPVQVGGGDYTIDYAFPAPEPAPVTTIAWRLSHVIVGVLAMRNASHFGAPAASWEDWEYPATAAGALDQLDTQVRTWLDGVRALSEEGLLVPAGDREPYPDLPMAALILHIHRELIHHLSEVSLLRDLYPHAEGAAR